LILDVDTGSGLITEEYPGLKRQRPGNGHPLGAVVTTRAIAEAFNNGMEYFNTFGGTPVACAAALAVLDIVEQQELQAKALETGNYLKEGLKQLAADHRLIGDIRGTGLFLGIDLVRNFENHEPAVSETKKAVNLLRHNGVLIGSTGQYDNVLKIRPPMVFSKNNADLLLQKLRIVLGLLGGAHERKPG